jgi:multimeric flavodoxin WrbA
MQAGAGEFLIMAMHYRPGPSIRIAVAYTSGQGHAARLAQHVALGAESVDGTEVALLDVAELTDDLWATLDRADAIIFGAPTYMGGPAAPFKAFADASSRVWYDQGWKDKIAAGFTVSGHMSGDKLHTLEYFSLLAAQHGMVWASYGAKGGWDTSTASADDLNRIGSWLGVAAQANKDQPADIAPPLSDLLTGQALGRRVARVARQFAAGRALTARLEPDLVR